MPLKWPKQSSYKNANLKPICSHIIAFTPPPFLESENWPCELIQRGTNTQTRFFIKGVQNNCLSG